MLQRHQLEALDGVALRGELLGALLGQHPVVGWTVHCCVLSAKKMKKNNQQLENSLQHLVWISLCDRLNIVTRKK